MALVASSCSVRPAIPASAQKAARPVTGLLVQQRRPLTVVRAEGQDILAIDYERTAAQKALASEWKPVIKVAVSGAAGQICNHLLFMLSSGEVYGRDQPIELRLLGSERSREALEGVAMELEDSLYPLLSSVKIGIDPEKVFADADWALLVGAKPRGPGMERAQLLDQNGQVFEMQGKALDKVCNSAPVEFVPALTCSVDASARTILLVVF
jgi:malate dehydrogenase (NADP+)